MKNIEKLLGRLSQHSIALSDAYTVPNDTYYFEAGVIPFIGNRKYGEHTDNIEILADSHARLYNQITDEVVPIRTTPFSIGRWGADYCVTDRFVSKKHAVIVYKKGQYWLYDCETRNGTLVNGKRIEGEVCLNEKATIKVGLTELLFTNTEMDKRDLKTIDSGQQENENKPIKIAEWPKIIDNETEMDWIL